ncbi:homospermidine synthase [Agrobacterium rosae]|uniref:Homospermidine synthase n=1 Tax=Agrobacterium rosae TaxID=1972867 RepID=A0AAE5S0F2_9HYPH|nr:homospermidine synthase [Agrobacterium rosae]KAA3513044.1 homospermidine synthase [Agrobacterium rosae]KAA3521467.1 homospermidine synthase [Agrobacterium rosae]MCM2432668.1 homospermidine synthase [Agrobacterium rosae]MDX8328261.1 homospermidine synthase [Agrobacterium rosae]MQB48378.1 homospermidine synthase [Agrobacterium rosae]
MTDVEHPIYGEITGPIIMIGFGSIGRGTLPLIERHFKFDMSRLVVIDPREDIADYLQSRNIRHIRTHLTKENYKDVMKPLVKGVEGQGFCVNLSVDASSVDLMKLCRKYGMLYIDTVVEPWPGFYFDTDADNSARTNYTLRETMLKEKAKRPGGTTAVSTCGANPGMVSWFVKQALVNLAKDTGLEFEEPAANDREGWARLMQTLGVKGVHIAERDTQRAKEPKPFNTFWNTWSVEGFIAEGMQPAELGWGSHEKWMPKNAKKQKKGSKAAIFLDQPGATTRVRTWCPTLGAQYGLLVTHNEAISISDYFTVRDKRGHIDFRPTCHYAYHPCNDAVLSLYEMFGNGGTAQPVQHVLTEDELTDGSDELGVLLYGHEKNAYWYGSRLTLEEARKLAPEQNATGLQVSSAVLSGMVWALENPHAGIVEADEVDYRRCLNIQRRYLGAVEGHYTDWTPLDGRPGLFPDDIDANDPWQFRNILVRG